MTIHVMPRKKTEKPISGVSEQHRLNNRVWFYKNCQSLLRTRVPYIINIAEGSISRPLGEKKKKKISAIKKQHKETRYPPIPYAQ